ncbi:MAG: hypothetical protein IJ002_08695 [Clostridia bacterium]|nr:hypothetical protein [Clostridia bacterium]
MKKLFGILLTLCLVVCALAISTSATTISSAEELVAIMNDSSKWADSYVLGNDIDLTGQPQTPIGNATTKFTGTFDGQEHTIKGVSISTATSYTGLFGCVEGGTIKNLTVEGTVTSTSGKYVGGIVGWSRSITLENCHSYVTVTGAGESVGGILGIVYYSKANGTSTISGCTNHKAVSSTSYTGGIVGDIYTGNYAGLSVTIDNCKNYGAVTVSGNVAGGIVGYIRLRTTSAANVSSVTIKNSANYATITAADYTGGIFGAYLTANNFYAKGIFFNLYNEGDMVVTSSSTTSYATPFAGGFAGLIRPSKLLDSAASTSLPFTLSDFCNKGTVYRTKIGGTEVGGSVIGTLGQASETVTLTLEKICNATGKTIILSADGLVNSADGVLVYNNQAAAVTTNTTVYGNNNYVSGSTEDEFNALAAEELWLAGWDSPELATFHTHTFVDGVCSCGKKTSVALDSSIDSVEEYLLLMNDPEAWSGSYTLSTSLDLTGYTITPIGNATTHFTGTFDGKGNTISGFSITGSGTVATEGIGLFGVISGDATIQNLNVNGTVNGSDTLGGIVGLGVAPFTIYKCNSDVTVANSTSRSGGIIGDVVYTEEGKTVSITYCTAKGALSGIGHVGGIVGRLYPTMASSVVNITNCENNATLSANHSSQADCGGIIGRLALTGSGSSVTISDCKNYGEANVTGGLTGGIIGEYVTDTTHKTLITNCANHAELTASAGQVAGIVGRFENKSKYTAGSDYFDTITNCANYGALNATAGSYSGGIVAVVTCTSLPLYLNNCYNEGNITVSASYAGGIVGYARNYGYASSDGSKNEIDLVFISDVYTKGNVTASSYVGGTVGYISNDGDVSVTNTVCAGTVTATSGEKYAASLGTVATNTGVAHTLTGNYFTTGTDANAILIETSTAYTDTLLGGDTAVWYTDAANEHAPELIAYHTHTIAAAVIDKDYHSLACWCGYVKAESEKHDFDSNNACSVCGYSDCAHENAVWSKVTADDETVTYSYVCECGVTLAEGVEKPYIYVDASGAGNDANNGITAATGVKTLAEAVSRMTATGGDVILVSDYAINASITDLPAYTNEITFTSQTDANDALVNAFVIGAHGITINFNGPTKVEKIIIDGTNTSAQNNSDSGYYNIPVFAANWNDLTFGEGVRAHGVSYIVLGSNGVSVSEKDLENKTVNLTLYRTTAKAVTDADGNTLTAAKATYDKVYLGDRVRSTDAFTVKNVNVNFTSYGATFNNVYLATTSGYADNVTMENYSVTANFGGTSDAYIGTIRTGDVNTTSGVSYIDNLVLNISENAYVKDALAIRNVKKLKMTVSSMNDGRITQNKVPFTIDASDAYAALEGVSGTVDITYGRHSFVSGVAYPTYNDIYTVSETLINDCDWQNDVTWSLNSETGKYVATCSACSAQISETSKLVVYVGPDGDDSASGLTADTKLATLTEAVSRISEFGGTVMINGMYTLSANEQLPAWNGTILFTADPDTHDSNGSAKSGFTIAKTQVLLSMGGDAKFDALLFKGTSSSTYRMILAANWNDIEMGYICVQNYATMYLLAGTLYQVTDDTDQKECSVTVDGPAMSTDAGNYFYERIYLGSIYLADGIQISNKKVTATFRDGYINSKTTTREQALTVATLYMMSTAGNTSYKASTTNGCTSIAYINDNAGIHNFRTGDKNVNMSTSEGKIDNVYIYFNDNSQIVDIGESQGTWYIRNAVNTYIYVSDMDETQKWEGEGVRTDAMIHSVLFERYGTFTATATATVTYGTHSFISSIDNPVRNNSDYVIEEIVTDECKGNWNEGEITTTPTPDAAGEKTYTCTVCGRTKTETVYYTCTAHAYAIYQNGAYVCSVCGALLDIAPTGGVVISGTPTVNADGTVTVDVKVTATTEFYGTIFSVTAPTGYTLTSATAYDSNGFITVLPTAYSSTYKIALYRETLDNATCDFTAATLTFTVDDTAEKLSVIDIDCIETKNINEEDVDTVTVDAMVAETLSVKFGTSVVLYSDFVLEFLVQADAENIGEKVWLEAVIAHEDETETVTIDAYKTSTSNGVTTFRFYAPNMAAKEMNDAITVTYHTVIEGVEYRSATKALNITNYYKLAHNAYFAAAEAGKGQAPAFMNLMYAMFNYGAAAQEYFKYNTANPVNAILPEDKQATEFAPEIDETRTYTVSTDISNAVYEFNGQSAVLDDKICMVFNYKLAENATASESDLVFIGSYTTVNGAEVNFTVSGDDVVVSDGTVTVYIGVINAKDIRQDISGALYTADADTQISATVTTSFDTYVNAAMLGEDEALIKICKAILCYSDAAKALFAPSEESN